MAKLNPFNPLNWLKSMQDWFVKAEKSSGFRPILIFTIIIFAFDFFLLKTFPEMEELKLFAILSMAGIIFVFLIVYSVKSFQDPDFCRSETHIQKMRKIKVETMGSDLLPIDGNIINTQTESLVSPDNRALPQGGGE